MPSNEVQTESRILEAIKRTSIVRCLSFTHARFSTKRLARLFPGAKQMSRKLELKLLTKFTKDMVQHNAVLRRGENLRINPVGGIRHVTFSSLDRYILQMHAKSIAKILEDLSKFADRVIPLIQQDRSAPLWRISNQILIQRRHWLGLACHVMNLLKLLGFVQHRMDSIGGVSAWRSPWPDFDCLVAAACRAAGNYECYGTADIEYSCI